MIWNSPGHELEFMKKIFTDKKEVILCGITNKTIDIYNRISFLKCDIFLADDFRQGDVFNKNIVSLKEIMPVFKKGYSFFIITEEDAFIRQHLHNKFLLMNLQENIDFFDADTFIKTYLPAFCYYSFEKCYIEFLGHTPNFACTMRCKHCSASIPYLKLKNPSVEQLKSEIDLLFSKVDFIYSYDWTGGEPFLISDKLVDIFEYLFDKYPTRFHELYITSNATVIPSERMLHFMQQHADRMTLNVSWYGTVPGWDGKHNKFKEVIEHHGLGYGLVTVNTWLDMGFNDTSLCHSDAGAIFNFEWCGNFCKGYIDGKLTYCSHGYFACLAHHPEIDVTKDILDLRSEQTTKKMILEYFTGFVNNGYLQICRHCNNWGTLNHHYIPIAEQLPSKYDETFKY